MINKLMVVALLTSFSQSIENYPLMKDSLTYKQKEYHKDNKTNTDSLLNSSDTKLLTTLDLDKIVEGLDLSPDNPTYTLEENSKPNITYIDNTIQNKLNIDLYNIVNRYMSITKYIPVKDPLWFIALGNVEYNYQSNPEGLWFTFPVKLEDYNPTFIENYNWKYVYTNFGLDAATRRTGGAIGPYQLESFFASTVDGVIPEDLGKRKDIWIELGDNPTPQYGTSITWAKGVIADRWNIADSANLTLDVYDTTLRKVNGDCALTRLDNKYSQVTLLMWAHNRGTGILGNEDYANKAERIATYEGEIRNFIKSKNIKRFSRTSDIMNLVKNISSEVGSDNYPVMALVSYIILEEVSKGVI